MWGGVKTKKKWSNFFKRTDRKQKTTDGPWWREKGGERKRKRGKGKKEWERRKRKLGGRMESMGKVIGEREANVHEWGKGAGRGRILSLMCPKGGEKKKSLTCHVLNYKKILFWGPWGQGGGGRGGESENKKKKGEMGGTQTQRKGQLG